MKPLRAPLLLLCALLACGDGPTAVVDVAELEGVWVIDVQANTSCSPNAVARTINLGLEDYSLDPGVRSINGWWEIGPSAVGLPSFTGDYDAETRRINILLNRFEFVAAFEGTVKSSARIDGSIVPPPAGSQPLYATGTCRQKATARKVA